jgi:hypothetical protein
MNSEVGKLGESCEHGSQIWRQLLPEFGEKFGEAGVSDLL